MSRKSETLAARLQEQFGEELELSHGPGGELGITVPAERLLEVATALRDTPGLEFAMLVDLAGVDYLAYGMDEWKTRKATESGFSRGVRRGSAPVSPDTPRRFAVVSHLLSLSRNQRLRLRCFAPPGDPPRLPTLNDVWPAANWFEREAFDLFGVLFDGHPDLRRILTDYGFIGHPFRKDFPLSGQVEVRYDPGQQRVVYEPVEIEPRTLVPRVIRDDHRYDPAIKD
ncbi:MAG: NADH-quinone oxidoreductase subunit C [Gammaproteobacteria bacterium]|jgi:NADH-quinone oxidoreductase subunit C